MSRLVLRVLRSTTPEQGTTEWLEWRRLRITASDCAKILRGADSKSYQTLIMAKCGFEKKFVGNKYTALGHELEEEILARFAEMYEAPVYTNLRPIEHEEHSRIGCSLDGITFAMGGANVEAKLIFQHEIIEKPKSEHVAQCMHQMVTSGLETTYICYLHYNVLETGEEMDEAEMMDSGEESTESLGSDDTSSEGTTEASIQVEEEEHDGLPAHLLKILPRPKAPWDRERLALRCFKIKRNRGWESQNIPKLLAFVNDMDDVLENLDAHELGNLMEVEEIDKEVNRWLDGGCW